MSELRRFDEVINEHYYSLICAHGWLKEQARVHNSRGDRVPEYVSVLLPLIAGALPASVKKDGGL